MTHSLFIEPHANGLAFYINGDLQFDSADEAIYHEHLVIPAIALAVQRFPDTPLRVLICGGGDGLAARDVLRFPQVAEVTLVDYSAAVLELGRTTFLPYNRGSLVTQPDAPLGAERVTVFTREAFEFISSLPDDCYHVVICDFTCPTHPSETSIYSREWYAQTQRVLLPEGILTVNAVSPENTPIAFWCLYQTLLAAGFATKPRRIAIPSFHRHEYGDWGFLLASPLPITRDELERLEFPADLQALQSESWLETFVFPAELARDRHSVCIHTLECPQLFYYLMNFNTFYTESSEASPTDPIHSAPANLDFLDIDEAGTGRIGTDDPLRLDTLAKFWIARLESLKQADLSTLEPQNWVPAQHYSQSPLMTREWLGHLRHLLSEIDGKQLLSSLLERAQELPPNLARDLKQLAEKLRTGQPIVHISQQTAELITILSVTLIMANLVMPDAVFAKGFRSRSSGGSSSYYNDGYYNSDGFQFGWIGFIMMVVGGFWMKSLFQDEDN